MTKKSKWKKIGVIGVDAGLVMVGDPCYGSMSERFKNWDEFCNYLGDKYPTMKSIPYELGHEGQGVVVSSGFGDGTYEVFVKTAKIKDWGERVTDLKVTFIEEEDLD